MLRNKASYRNRQQNATPQSRPDFCCNADLNGATIGFIPRGLSTYRLASHELALRRVTLITRIYLMKTTTFLKLPLKFLWFIALGLFVVGCEEPCDKVDCQNGGVCDDGYCLCEDGYEGARCQDRVTTALEGKYSGDLFMLTSGRGPRTIWVEPVPGEPYNVKLRWEGDPLFTEFEATYEDGRFVIPIQFIPVPFQEYQVFGLSSKHEGNEFVLDLEVTHFNPVSHQEYYTIELELEERL